MTLARRAREELALESVLMVPTLVPAHKPPGEDPGAEHRLEMCRLAVAGLAGVAACDAEIERGGPSYTVDTLRSIHATHPDAQLTLIVGADTASTMPTWREPSELLELADLAIAARAGTDRASVLRTLGRMDGARSPRHTRFLTMEPVDVSSSLARERARRGEPIEDLVGPAVAGYIAEHGLYRGLAAAG